eukprot:CAMPEP_0119116742 /NCGR_PEP_ID=MMETSP1180-20130426/52455_1 /TAXON_ID=3052 ORGANISM="Chlamydomonas cf sp, Strain CCMP681" /NCGR_SAMPLE_ID=MMETSP1180 /ASSEMBLY_ACC=CAM_ASM_000741 /LENGTH=100 /DNA_ID=CAMNT_0007105927 /DNA_START=815 /DNA_END=1117 /DNA_ORIENTATION=+
MSDNDYDQQEHDTHDERNDAHHHACHLLCFLRCLKLLHPLLYLDGRRLNAAVNAIQDGALLHHKRGQVAHDLCQFCDRLHDFSDLPVPFLCEHVTDVHHG